MVATSLSLCNSSEKPVEKLPYSKGQPPKSAMLSRIMASGFLENFSARAQIVWAALWSHSGSCVAGDSGDYFTERCWPSESQLASELGCDARTVRRAIRQLVSGGAVRRDRRGRRMHWHAGSVLVIPKVAIQANAPDRTKVSSRNNQDHANKTNQQGGGCTHNPRASTASATARTIATSASNTSTAQTGERVAGCDQRRTRHDCGTAIGSRWIAKQASR